MNTTRKDPGDEQTTVRVRRGRVDSVDLYEIKDNELDLLESGSPASLQLNFSIFLVSIASSAACTLATATFASRIVENIFLFVTIIGFLLGAYLFAAWFRTRSSVKDVCDCIRARIPPEVARPALPEARAESRDETDQPSE